MATEWFYSDNGQQIGPISSADLKKLAATGRVDTETLIWKAGMPDWVRAGTTKGLFPQVPPPIILKKDPLEFIEPASSRKKHKGSSIRSVLLTFGIGIIALLGMALLVQNGNPPVTDPVTGEFEFGFPDAAHMIGSLAIGSFFYLLPAVVAFSRHHHNRNSILIVDLFLGWTLIGWVVALAWALTESPSKR